MAFGANPTTTTQTTLANNQFPLSTVAVPGTANGDLTALEGGPASTDANSNKTAPASMYVKDGNNVAQGTTTDAAVINPALSATEVALLKGLLTKINTLVTNSPILGQAAMVGSAPVVIANNQTAVPVSGTVSVGNFPGTQPVSGTVTANVGTTNGLALDTSVNGVIVAQGSTTSGEKGPLVQGSVTATPPAYTAGQTSPINLTQTGAVRTDASATTQPVSGTVTANQGGTWTVQPGNTANTTAWKVDGSAVTQPVNGTVTTTQATGTNLHTVVDSGSVTATQATGSNLHAVLDSGSTTAVTQATPANLNAQVVGSVASAGSNAGNPVKTGGAFNTTQPTVTTGQIVDMQMTARGAQIVATGADTFNATINAALPTGANTIGNVGLVAGSAVIGSTTIQATSGTALVADQTNSELRVSNYGKSAVAGDTALALTSAGFIIIRQGVDLVYTTTQTGISATADSGDLVVSQYKELLIYVNLSAFTGTSIQFKVQGKDNFTNYIGLASPTALTTTGTAAYSVGVAASNNIAFGDIIRIQWLCTAVTSATFQLTLKGK